MYAAGYSVLQWAISLLALIFLARRPGGGVTELRTHEQGLVGVR